MKATPPPTGRRIVLELVNEMEGRLYPLMYRTLAPGIYHVYIHPDDYKEIEAVVPLIVVDAQQGLNARVDELNRKAKWWGLVAKTHAAIETPRGGWEIYIHADANGEIGRGEIGIVSRLSLPVQPQFEGGTPTTRIAKTVVAGGVRRSTPAENIAAPAPLEAAPAPIAAPLTALPAIPAVPTATAAAVPSGAAAVPSGAAAVPSAAPAPAPPPASPVLPSIAPSIPTPSLAELAHPSAAPVAPEPVMSSASPSVGAATTAATAATVTAERSVPTVAASPGHSTGFAQLSYIDEQGPHIFVMRKDLVSIGRGGSAHWVDVQVVTTARVSREHCRIRRDADGRFFLQDISAWGTSVDGQTIAPYLRRNGDRLEETGEERELPRQARIQLADALIIDFEVQPR